MVEIIEKNYNELHMKLQRESDQDKPYTYNSSALDTSWVKLSPRTEA